MAKTVYETDNRLGDQQIHIYICRKGLQIQKTAFSVRFHSIKRCSIPSIIFTRRFCLDKYSTMPVTALWFLFVLQISFEAEAQ